MKINKIQYGLIPYGPAMGQRQILIDFYKGSLVEVLNPNSQSSIDLFQDQLYEDFENKIKEQNLTEEYIQACNASQSVFLVFRGPILIKEFELASKFNQKIMNYAVNIQKELIQEKLLAPNKLKPPFCIWVGKPIFNSGKNMAYQLYNCLYPLINIRYPDDPNDMAIAEILQHQYQKLIYLGDKPTDFEAIVKIQKKFNQSTAFYVAKNNQPIEQDFCILNNLRFNFNPIEDQYMLSF